MEVLTKKIKKDEIVKNQNDDKTQMRNTSIAGKKEFTNENEKNNKVENRTQERKRNNNFEIKKTGKYEGKENSIISFKKINKETAYKYLCYFVFFTSVVSRVFLIHYGVWIDSMNIEEKSGYTDVDYHVFTDASAYIFDNFISDAHKNNNINNYTGINYYSPYTRTTYRYTPILAYVTTLNLLLFESFGKYFFASMDLFVGFIIWKILRYTNREDKITHLIIVALTWLLNPIVIVISTRGSADSLPCLFVVLFLFFLLVSKSLFFSALCFGFAVHLKIFPIIYCIPILLFINKDYFSNGFFKGVNKSTSKDNNYFKVLNFLYNLVAFPFQAFIHLISLNKKQIIFGFSSGALFCFLAAIFYFKYGYVFLHETYLYHIWRHDYRHNFSFFFYFMYLISDNPLLIYSLLTFLPQMISSILVGTYFAKQNLEFSLFLQTIVFVALNKVCTSQYFIWWICLMPFAIDSIRLNFSSVFMVIFSNLFFLISKGMWLYWRNELEFKAQNVFLKMLLCGSIWVCISQISIAITFIYFFKFDKIKQTHRKLYI